MNNNGERLRDLREALRQANDRSPAPAPVPDDRTRQALAMLAAVFAQVPMAATLSRASDGAYVEVNDEWLQLMGFAREEALGSNAVALGIWPDGAERARLLQPLREHGAMRNVPMTFLGKDRQPRNTLLSGFRVELDGTAYYLIFLIDVTAAHVAQTALQASQASLQRLNEQLNHQVTLYDLTERLAKVGHWIGTKEGGFSHWSPSMYALAGLKPGTVTTRESARAGIVEEDKELFNQARQRMDGKEIEYRFNHVDGTVHWVRSRLARQYNQDGEVLFDFGVVQDITAEHHARQAVQAQLDSLRQSQAKLEESEARFRSLTELSSDWYWEQDENYRFVRFEGTGSDIDGPSNANLGQARWDIPAPNLTEQDWARHRAVLDARQPFRDFELQRKAADGQATWFLISGLPIFDAQGCFRGYRGIGRDITERKRTEAKIQHLAFFDALTGLPNRRMLLDRLLTAQAASGRYQQRGALLFIDLDNFKDLNDTQGHDVGDQLLKQVAQRLTACVREIDTVARLGGDEFVVMLEELDATEEGAAAQAEAVGKKVLSGLNQPYHLASGEHHSTPSLGVTLFFAQQESVDELLKRADLAMYQAKSAGRNTLRFYDPKMQAAVSARAALEADLRQSLLRHELMLYYQPVVNEQIRITGFEALLRWRHPVRGMVTPGDFIPLAEQTGLILPMGQWVLEQALGQLVQWNGDARTRGLTIAVNVSARQFRHPDFALQVLELLKRTGANPYRLKLELTESLLLLDVQDAINKMTELRSIGVSFSLDDFGTGYSSLSYLKRLPLDQLKIDQSFVRDVLTDPNDAAIARTVLALAQSLDLAVVAEGVEAPGQRDFLVRNGCKAFQGYLFGRPAPIEDFMSQLLAD
jgi:diguanylate cyclase (GGDEF)-like protein/PAS domain S-box-containing protein